MNRSHSRKSFPLDKPVPRERWRRQTTAAVRRVIKRMHIRKQRQYNRRLVRG